MDDSQIHRLMTQAGCGGTLTPAVRRFALACRAAIYSAEQAQIEAPLRAEIERLRAALEFAEYLAKQAEYLLTALEYEDMARVAWDESGTGTPEFERWGNATNSRCEHARQLRARIYEFRKRIPRDPNYPCRSDGRCQYAIDHGAEGMGHCPAGKCAMPETPNVEFSGVPAGHSSNHPAGGTSAGTQG